MIRAILKSVVEQAPAFSAAPDMGFCTPRMIEEKWEHRDFPRMPREVWTTILLLIEGQYSTLTSARYPNGQMRGQILVSPEGIRLMKERADALDT